MDLDLILRISEDEIPKLAEFLTRKDFWVNAEELKTALREKTHCTILDKKSLFRLDIKGIYTEADRRTFERRIPFEYKGIKIYIATAEDLIASKLLYGSEQDMKDAEAIYIRQFEKLDMKYLEKICKEMGVSRELAKLKRKLKPFLSKEIKNCTDRKLSHAKASNRGRGQVRGMHVLHVCMLP
jgi:hypothetical protein